MFAAQIRSVFRSLTFQLYFSSITIAGLAIGLAAFILIVLLITVLTISLHSGKIARQTPVESIRCE